MQWWLKFVASFMVASNINKNNNNSNRLPLSTEVANYHFIKDKAYTEDDVLVYNIFVWNIPMKTSKAEFLEYFEKFGEVVSVHLLNVRRQKVNNRNSKIGFSNFKDPVSAAKVLKKPVHAIKTSPVYVKACHSWHQPDAQRAATSTAADDEMETNVSSLLTLNDDCLDVLFKYMEIKDQTNLASCCSRLRDVFIMRGKIEYKMLDLEHLECLTLWQIRNFFQMVGSHIEKIKGPTSSHHFKSVIEFIGEYCVNVKSISMCRQHISANSLRKLLKNTKLVEALNLDDVELKDESIPQLRKLKNLKQLSLDKNFGITGRDIKFLTTVQDLSLHGCKLILPTFFKSICENLKDLKCLNIQECSSLKAVSMLDIVKHLHKLETIKLSYDNDQIGCIASLPSLKNLCLCAGGRYGIVPAQIFQELAKLKADQLEILTIPYRNGIDFEKISCIGELSNLKELTCPNNNKLNDNCLEKISQLHELVVLDIQKCNAFTARGLLDLIQKCKKLKTLNIAHCRQLDVNFATKLLELLIADKKQRKQNKPLRLIVSWSRFSVTSAAFEEASDILTIAFGYGLESAYMDLEDSDIDDYFYDQDDDDDYNMYFSDPDDSDDDDLNLMPFNVMHRAAFGNWN